MEPELDFFENFFSEKESTAYLKALQQTIPWQQKTIRLFGKSILEPRLTSWHGDRDAVYAYSGIQMKPQVWTPVLLEIRSRLEKACGASFNSVLLNLYRDQHDSMGLHSDDEKELGSNPLIASVSFGEPRRFIMKHKLKKMLPTKTYLLHSGDLLVMRGDTQKLWKHGIPKENKPCGPRINLTFRKIYSTKSPAPHSSKGVK